MTRIIYHNPAYRTKLSKTNYALAITNQINTQEDTKMIYKWSINVEIPNSFIVEKIVGKALEEYEYCMQSLIDFILKGMNIRIKYIVADFIKDSKGNLWLVDLKSFRVPKEKYHLFCLGNEKNNCEILARQKSKQFYAKCRLCNMNYGREELQYLITMNMIIQYKKHLNQRGIYEFEHVDVLSIIFVLEVQKI